MIIKKHKLKKENQSDVNLLIREYHQKKNEKNKLIKEITKLNKELKELLEVGDTEVDDICINKRIQVKTDINEEKLLQNLNENYSKHFLIDNGILTTSINIEALEDAIRNDIIDSKHVQEAQENKEVEIITTKNINKKKEL